MKTPLYLVAMIGAGTGKPMVWVSTSNMEGQDDCVCLQTFEFEYEVAHREETIIAMLDAKKNNEVAKLQARLKELGAA